MDTLGLHPLGLPDAQIYFDHLSESRVAGLLLDLAEYVFNTVVIEPGTPSPGQPPTSDGGSHTRPPWQVQTGSF